MKFFLSVCFSVLLLACNDNDSKEPSKTMVDTMQIKTKLQNPYAALDISPIDISYFPADYPIQKMTGHISTLPIARVIYGRPHKQGRKIFGALLKYGEPWRMGANESTEIEFFQPVTIQDKKIARGRYVLYCILNADKWTIILNNNLFSWGLKPDASKDLFHFDVPVEHNNQSIEYFTMVFEKAMDKSTNLFITWDDVVVRLPIKF